MKLLSTRFVGENSIELTYADDPQLEAATTFVSVRLPREVDGTKSLAWHRFWALADLQELIAAAREAERKTVESNR